MAGAAGERLIPIVEAAARLKESPWTLRRWLARAPGCGVMLGGRWFVRDSGLYRVRELASRRPAG
mgnify:CR=1 FL=1